MPLKKTKKLKWNKDLLKNTAESWFKKQRKLKNKNASIESPWWSFAHDWLKSLPCFLDNFNNGTYHFDPMRQYVFTEDCIIMWNDSDRLALNLFLQLVKPVFKHITSPRCFHLEGPNGVKKAIALTESALQAENYFYAIRLDIQSYFASIDRTILMNQIKAHFNDPRVLHYFEQIVNHGVDNGGNVFVPHSGIPIRSSTSNFLGALYLTPLDRAFENKKNIFYARYQDDIIILIKTKRAFNKAKRLVFKILAALKLKKSPSKTWMGELTKGFHFLGIFFESSQNTQVKSKVCARLHPRSCARALNKVKAMSSDAVHPATIQRYLIRW